MARLHSGDLSIYSALAEQVRRLERLGIAYSMTPGVPAFIFGVVERPSSQAGEAARVLSLAVKSSVGSSGT